MSSSIPSVLGGSPPRVEANGQRPFMPRAVATFEEAGLSHAVIESLVLKFLVNVGTAAGRRIAA